MYRMLVFKIDIPSCELVEKITPEELDDMFYAFEMQNCDDSVEEIAKKWIK